MKNTIITCFITAILIISSCRKTSNTESIIPLSSGNHVNFHLARESKILYTTTDSPNANLSTLKALFTANASGVISLIRTIDGGVSGANPLYNILGQINDNTANQTYTFSVGTNINSGISRTGVYSSDNGYMFSSTQVQQQDTPSYGGYYADKAVTFTIKKNGTSILSKQITSLQPIYITSLIDPIKGRSNATVNWNADANNTLGVAVTVIAMDSTGTPQGGVYDLYPDSKNSQNIAYILNEYPNCPIFNVQIYRGNYFQGTASNGQTYIVALYSESHQAMSYKLQ